MKNKFNLQKNYANSQYIKRLPYIRDKGPQFDNSIINVIQNFNDLKNFVIMAENCKKT